MVLRQESEDKKMRKRSIAILVLSTLCLCSCARTSKDLSASSNEEAEDFSKRDDQEEEDPEKSQEKEELPTETSSEEQEADREEPEKKPVRDWKDLYLEVISEYESAYGKAELVPSMETSLAYMTGLFYARLLDLDQNGTEELILGYYTPEERPVTWGESMVEATGEHTDHYSFAVYSYDEAGPLLLCEGTGYNLPSMGTGPQEYLEIQWYQGQYYISCGYGTSTDDYRFYYGFDGERFGLVHSEISLTPRDAGPED